MLVSFGCDQNVVSKCSRYAPNGEHGPGPWHEHEGNKCHRKGASLGDAHGVPMRPTKHPSHRIVVHNIGVESIISMPKLRGKTSMSEHQAKQDERDLVEAFENVCAASCETSIDELGQFDFKRSFVPGVLGP